MRDLLFSTARSVAPGFARRNDGDYDYDYDHDHDHEGVMIWFGEFRR
jgi:hypothetical protein